MLGDNFPPSLQKKKWGGRDMDWVIVNFFLYRKVQKSQNTINNSSF